MKTYGKFFVMVLFLAGSLFVSCNGGSSMTDADSVVADTAALDSSSITFSNNEDNTESVTDHFILPVEGENGTIISWESNSETIAISGSNATVSRPGSADGDENVILTATIKRGNTSEVKQFLITVKALSACTVTFNSQEGNAVDNQTVDEGGLIVKPSDPIKTENTFSGWFKDEECIDAWVFSSNKVSESMMLYAKWTINQYTVTYDSQEGTDVPSATLDYDTKISEPENPSREGYTFKGWFKEEGCSSEWIFASETITENITLYAKWTINQYTLTYNVGQGNTSGAVPANVTSYDYNTSIVVLENTGYLIGAEVGGVHSGVGIRQRFDKWNTQADGNGTDWLPGTSFSIKGNTILYAFYTEGDEALRKIGRHGGWIFYDKGSYSDGWRYLEAATVDYKYEIWGGCGMTIIGAAGSEVGTGKQNTIDILAKIGNSESFGYAAKTCDDKPGEWFLPSLDELKLMYQNLHQYGVGDFVPSDTFSDIFSYWSSTKGYNDDYAYLVGFANGNSSYGYRDDKFRVRSAIAY